MKALCFFCLCCSFLGLYGQTQWGRALGPTSFLDGRAITACTPDGRGGYYVVGNFKDTMAIDGLRIESYGGTDVFVAHVSPQGGVIDLYSVGDVWDEEAFSIAVYRDSILTVGGRQKYEGASAWRIFAMGMTFDDERRWRYDEPQYESFPDTGGYSEIRALAMRRKNDYAAKFPNTLGVYNGSLADNNGFCPQDARSKEYGSSFTGEINIVVHQFSDPGERYHQPYSFYTCSLADSLSAVQPAALAVIPASDTGMLDWEFQAGSFRGKLNIHETQYYTQDNSVLDSLTARGASDMYFSGTIKIIKDKYESHIPQYKRFGCLTDTAGEEAIRALVTDAEGNIYMTGSYVGPAVFDDVTLEGFGGTDVFVAKISPAGAVLQVVGAGGPGNDDAHTLKMTPDGRLIIAGTFESEARFGGDTLVSSGGKDVFLSEIDFATLEWRRTRRVVTGPNDEAVHGLALDTLTGGALLAGDFKEVCYAGPDTLLYGGLFVVGVDLPRAGDQLSAIEPARGFGLLKTRVIGYPIAKGARIALEGQGRRLMAQNVRWYSEYACEATFDLAGMPLGVYDVEATLPDGGIQRLEDGFTVVDPTSVAPMTPASPLTLHAPYPNPATETLSAPFVLNVAALVEWKVTDITGRTVRTGAPQLFPTGTHTTTANVDGLSPGLYLFILETENARAAVRFMME